MAEKQTLVQVLFSSYPASDLIAADWAACATLTELYDELIDRGDDVLRAIVGELMGVERDNLPVAEYLKRLDGMIRDLQALRRGVESYLAG